MKDAHEAEMVRTAVLRALDQSPDAQDLAAIHTLLNRPQKDISLLPIVGGLVSAGYVEKVAPTRDSANHAHPSRRGQPVPVRFRITEQGRVALQSAPKPQTAEPQPAGAGDGFDDDDQV